MENRYKDEIEDLTKRYEQIKAEKEILDKRLKEVRKSSLKKLTELICL